MTELREQSTGTLEWLQVLRGFAALAVVLFHFKDPLAHSLPALAQVLELGSTGVDIFFIVSGFIIYQSTRRSASQDAVAFLVRRVTRIVLPAWVAMSLMALAKPPRLSDLSDLILGFLFVLPRSAPAPTYGYGFLIVAWTLTYELYFYAMFALALALSRRARCDRALSLLGLMLLPMVGLQLWLGGFTVLATGLPDWRSLADLPGASLLGVAANPMLLEFLVGVGLAWIYARLPARLPVAPTRGLALLLLGAGLSWFASFQARGVPVDHGFALAGGPSLLVVLGILGLQLSTRGTAGGALQNSAGRALMRMGDASYSLYLIHPVLRSLLITAAVHAGLTVGAGLSVLGVFLSIALALPFHRWIELPSQRLGRQWARRWTVSGASE